MSELRGEETLVCLATSTPEALSIVEWPERQTQEARRTPRADLIPRGSIVDATGLKDVQGTLEDPPEAVEDDSPKMSNVMGPEQLTKLWGDEEKEPVVDSTVRDYRSATKPNPSIGQAWIIEVLQSLTPALVKHGEHVDGQRIGQGLPPQRSSS
ncbi:hypothetical protein Dimus_012019 [Dionaea muscipula]